MKKSFTIMVCIFGMSTFFIGGISVAATGYQPSNAYHGTGGYQGSVSPGGMNQSQNNCNRNYNYNQNRYNAPPQVNNSQEEDGSTQTQQVQEMKQWLNDHPGQRDQVQQIFQSN